jgi:hypothetical protein
VSEAGYGAFREQVRRDILDAYRPSRRRRLWWAVTLFGWRHRKQRAWLDALDAASAEARAREARYRDVVLPARVAAIEQGLNERFADLLPEGMRWEWASTEDEGEAPDERA